MGFKTNKTNLSTSNKKAEITTAIILTKIVELIASCFFGQVILETSNFTSFTNRTALLIRPSSDFKFDTFTS